MKRYSIFGVALCAAVSCATASIQAAPCAPATLDHIVVTDVTPGLPAASFGAQPRGMYRIGSDKLRVEEANDPTNGIHQIIVDAEPNIWMVNLDGNTGEHIVDPGPELYAVAPVIGFDGVSPKLLALEFGCESQFLAANAPNPVRSEQVGTVRYDVFRVTAGANAVEILEKPGTGTPSFVRYYKQGKLAMDLRYDLYVTGLPADPSLFAMPTGITFTEAHNSN
jgi:hypothetical protein